MAFLQLVCTALKLNKLKNQLTEEKLDAINVGKKQKPKWKLRHIGVDIRVAAKRFTRKALSCFFFEKFCYKLRHDGSCENYTLKSAFGFISGFALTYIFFMFSMFQLNFKLTTATIMCSVLGCILTLGLAFSSKVRCIVLLTLPQFFSQRGRQALLAYAFILAVSGPAKNTLNNLGILTESLACGQEQLKAAVRQIIDAIKKPFLALKEAIKKLVKTVKEIVKKIKEILLTIKRIIMAIIRVIKAAFEFLAKIINICNKELGTPFERCSRVFENAIADCNAKLGPLFNWLCSLAYIVQSVCYLVKFLDLICILVDFISNSVIGVVIRKVKSFIRHVRTMFYVRIKFSHSFQFHTNTSKSMAEVAHGIVGEIKDRTRLLVALFNFLTSAATLFFIFMIFKVTVYRFRFLTNEKYDNRYITKNFRDLDMRRATLGKETVLPLNNREMAQYVSVDSRKLSKTEKKAMSKAINTLATASLKLAIIMANDYCLFWILNLIQYYGRFQSKVQAPNIPTAHISGRGLLSDLLRGIVKAFQPLGIQLEIDTIPCLPIPIPPNYDRYVQIVTLIILCWVLTLLEPYGLRLRHIVMSYYHPVRAKERAIWLYNHIMRSRNSFLKFARRQLRRKVMSDRGIEKITCKEYLAANFRVCGLCLGEGLQTACLLCGQVFRESDDKKPIRCQTPGCPGVYCEQCFADLQNLCTICLSPIDYGDMSDISEERDSSEEEPRWPKRKIDKDVADSKLPDKPDDTEKPKDSDYYSSDSSTDYSFSYQYDKNQGEQQLKSSSTVFKDVEKQEIPDYASMESFREEPDEIIEVPPTTRAVDKTTMTSSKKDIETGISGTTFKKFKKMRHIDFVGVPSPSKESLKRRPSRREKKEEEIPLIDPALCFCSDSEDSDLMQAETPLILARSTTSTTTDILQNAPSTSSEDLSEDDADVDSEVKEDLRHIDMLIPELNLSEVTESERGSKQSFAEDKFSSVTYDEISESSPRSTLSIGNLVSSTDISLREELADVIGAKYERESVPKERKSTEHQAPKVEEASHLELQASSSSFDSYNIANAQKKRVKEYYKAVQDIPTKSSVEETPKPNRFMKFFRKIFPKRKKDLNDLPLYSKDKEVIELKSYNYTQDQWDTLSTSSVDDREENLETPQDLTSSEGVEEEEEEAEEWKRIRGGQSGLFRNPLKKHRTGYIQLKKVSRPTQPAKPKESSVTEDILSKYFVSIEDLTPTRDCGPMSTAEPAIKPAVSFGHAEVLAHEIPEKDEVKPTSRGSTSSNLSEGFCKSILGKACKRLRKTTPPERRIQDSQPVDTIYVNKESATEREPSKKESEADETSQKIEAVQEQERGSLRSQKNNTSDPKQNSNSTTYYSAISSQTNKENREENREVNREEKQNVRDLNPSSENSIADHSLKLGKEFTPCECKDKKNQTFPASILKFKSPSGKSLITLKEPTVASQTSQLAIFEPETMVDVSRNKIDSVETYPVKERKCSSSCQYKERFLLTSDKMQQTSTDDIYQQGSGTSNRATMGSSCCPPDSMKARSSSMNNRPSTCIEIPDTYRPTSSNYCECRFSMPETGDPSCGYMCCRCPPPPPPRYEDYVNLKETCCRNMSPPEAYPKYPERQHRCNREPPSEHTMCSKGHRKVYRDFPTDDMYSCCESQCKECKKSPVDAYPSEHTRRSRPSEPDCQRHRQSPEMGMSPCPGECEYCMRHRKPRQPPSHSYRCCPIEYDSSSSEPSDVNDEDDYYADCPPNRFDLPYQNNQDYLDLVQELEETLQSRNRNRVRRAMQEFEQRSKCNKPLEQPIINYDETSESEEPIIEKITKLTSERIRCCPVDMCSCRRKASHHFGKTSQNRVKEQLPRSGGYRRTPRCRQRSGERKTHWQLDQNSGEWYKVSDNPQKRKSARPSRTPSRSPQRDYCPHNCKCCGSRRYDYR